MTFLRQAIIFVLTLFCLSTRAQESQTITMSRTGERSQFLLAGSCYTLLDPGGTGNYPGSCNATMVVYAPEGYKICIDGSFAIDPNAVMSIYRGEGTTGQLFRSYTTGTGSIFVTMPDNVCTIRFFADSDHPAAGFSVKLSAIPPPPIINRLSPSFHSCDVSWTDDPDATEWYIRFAGWDHWDTLTTTSYHFDSLDCFAAYSFSLRNNLPVCSDCNCPSEGVTAFKTRPRLEITSNSTGYCDDTVGFAETRVSWNDYCEGVTEWYIKWWPVDNPDTTEATVTHNYIDLLNLPCCTRFKILVNNNVNVIDSCCRENPYEWKTPCEYTEDCTTHVHDIEVEQVTARTATISWQDYSTQTISWRVFWGEGGQEQSKVVSQKRATITGLKAATTYIIRVEGGADDITTCPCRPAIATTLCPEQIYRVSHGEPTYNSCYISWRDHSSTASRWSVVYGPEHHFPLDTIETTRHELTLTGLRNGTHYLFNVFNNDIDRLDRQPVGACVSDFYTEGSICECFDDFESYVFANAHYGSFENPDQNRGVIDRGFRDASSRHTVHTDTSERDERTSFMLRTIPEGKQSSVRLGNWLSGAEGESITYLYTVDTTRYNVIILHYAAVLQNPGHPSSSQPKFSFRLFNKQGQLIDPECLSHDFVAQRSLGWNYDTTNNTLWKDWTDVAINLANLHDSTIYIKLTTQDCKDGGHYGYAYYTFDCSKCDISIQGCGDAPERTLGAADGFNYFWYKEGAPGDTISTEQTITVTDFGRYVCRMSPIGNDMPECAFERYIMSGTRFPKAQYDYYYRDTIDCKVAVKFINQSCVTADPDHETTIDGQQCDSYQWFFSDGETSSERDPIHLFPEGDHYAILVAGLSDNQCTDTILHNIHIEELPRPKPFIHHSPEFATMDELDITLINIGSECDISQWYLDDSLRHIGNSYLYQYPAFTDNIPVELLAYHDNGCTDSTFDTILFHHFGLWAPNVFTPGQESNKLFVIKSSNLASMEVFIFNRRGEYICTFDGLTEGWDGTKQGHFCPQGAYVYLIKYRNRIRPDEVHQKKGTVLLLRE